ncbi:conserved hypothetical protein [Neospora caninum Liverpool]|uniref:Transmembrane protein n=1 Tax=Neospora caninum (strain Liverpool) TaxID=572307 RepID=F0VQD3_NEOCL|nr:conserved hypothetical protein [Neospora caninum Liverpool]CBZ55930.1 conserved hypothetical protein [Neospora caninum Liverpool]CEL70673.1 TPA: hypothetical protein BN1204_063560 [Neospora caninum Liverpool]|eukprot:XP_003885956.1 conserved hypothetical protein [Neospora caninum Liverpool]
MQKLSCFGGPNAVRHTVHTEVAQQSVSSTSDSARETCGSVVTCERRTTCDTIAVRSGAEQVAFALEALAANACSVLTPQSTPLAASRQTRIGTPRGVSHAEDESDPSMWASTEGPQAGARSGEPSAERGACRARHQGSRERAGSRRLDLLSLATRKLRPQSAQRMPCFWIAPEQERPAHFFFIRILWLFVYFLVVDVVMSVVGVSSDYFYMLDPQPQLKDRVHDWIFGGKPPAALSQVVADSLTVSLIVITGIRHLFFVRMPLSIMIVYRCIAIIISVYVLRTIAIFVTTMPAPVEDCTPSDIGTASGFMMQAFLAASFQTSLCTDMIISGHTLTTAICMATWLFYNNCNKHDNPEKDIILFYFLRDKIRARWTRCVSRWCGRLARRSRKDPRDKATGKAGAGGRDKSVEWKPLGGFESSSNVGMVDLTARRGLDLHTNTSDTEKGVFRNNADGEGCGRSRSEGLAVEAGLKEELEIVIDAEGSSAAHDVAQREFQCGRCDARGQASEPAGTRENLSVEVPNKEAFKQKEGRLSSAPRGGSSEGERQAPRGNFSRPYSSDLEIGRKKQTTSCGWFQTFWATVCEWNLLGVYCLLHGAVNIIIIDFSFCHYTVDICFGLLVAFAIYTAYHMILSLLWAERAESLRRVSTGPLASPGDGMMRNPSALLAGCLHTGTSLSFGESHGDAEILLQPQGCHAGTTRPHAAGGATKPERTLADGLRGEAVSGPLSFSATAILDFPLVRFPAFLIRRLEGMD